MFQILDDNLDLPRMDGVASLAWQFVKLIMWSNKPVQSLSCRVYLGAKQNHLSLKTEVEHTKGLIMQSWFDCILLGHIEFRAVATSVNRKARFVPVLESSSGHKYALAQNVMHSQKCKVAC